MVDPTTPNISLAQPVRNSDVGVWDTPVNNNMGILDLVTGGVANLTVSNANVTLSPSQYQCGTIIVNGTLTANLSLVFPSTFIKAYNIFNNCTGTQSFYFNCTTGVAGGFFSAPPPGEFVSMVNDGTSIRYVNLGGPIGSYMNIATNNIPLWITGSFPNPYLYCNGGTFASSTYPFLFSILGGNTLPDTRGTAQVAIDNSAGRIGTYISQNTVGAIGGVEGVILLSSQMPTHTHGVTDPTHTHALNGTQNFITNFSGAGIGGGGAFGVAAQVNSYYSIGAAATGISIQNAGGSGAHINLQPTTIIGLNMIRSA